MRMYAPAEDTGAVDVSHIQLASKAASSNEVMLCAEGGDLRSAVGAHWCSPPGQAAAVQHLHSSTASKMSLKAPDYSAGRMWCSPMHGHWPAWEQSAEACQDPAGMQRLRQRVTSRAQCQPP